MRSGRRWLSAGDAYAFTVLRQGSVHGPKVVLDVEQAVFGVGCGGRLDKCPISVSDLLTGVVLP